MKACVYLENGVFFTAKACGAGGTYYGELVFNTSLTGYQEIISDPSYAGQFIVFSMPELGIVGTNENDDECKEVFASGILMRNLNSNFSNFRAQTSLDEYLKKRGKIGLYELDTRALVKMIRDLGNLRAVISTEFKDKNELKNLLEKSPRIEELNLVALVSTKKPYKHTFGAWDSVNLAYKKGDKAKKKVAVLDYGVKRNILNELVECGLAVEVLPHSTKADELIKRFEKGEIQGIFLSNGPGEPKVLKAEINELKKLIKAKIPMLGICLGHQLLSNAFGYETYKMKFGQHGANHPVLHQQSKVVEITAQNHNYNVPESICEVATITHRNLFGDNVEGVVYKDYPIISVQHHPESSSGPHESKYIFNEFAKLL